MTFVAPAAGFFNDRWNAEPLSSLLFNKLYLVVLYCENFCCAVIFFYVIRNAFFHSEAIQTVIPETELFLAATNFKWMRKCTNRNSKKQ